MALALPIEVPNQNLYMSFNLEANYALPTQSTDFTQGLYEKVLLVDGVNKAEEVDESDNANEVLARGFAGSSSLISRKHVYEMIEKKIGTYGLDGRACLLRAICEASRSNFIDTNGVIGSIVHIILS